MPIETPVAFCVFNRPDLAEIVLSAIAKAKPRRLLVFSDGPRANRPGEAEKVDQSRRLLERVDWNCDVETDFSDVNLGCKRRISSGISWALEKSDRTIILEDDCRPAQSFFAYCERLLDRYQDEPRVMAVSGDNFQKQSRTPHSYYFSKFTHCWGWATWARAWHKLDLELATWSKMRETDLIERWSDCPEEAAFWRHTFDVQAAGNIDSWAFPWLYSCWLHGGMIALPDVNLVSNIGFGDDATHTTHESELANLPTGEITQWSDPPTIERQTDADLDSFYRLFQPTVKIPSQPKPKWRRAWSRFKRYLRSA